jgi:hypothetical protein
LFVTEPKSVWLRTSGARRAGSSKVGRARPDVELLEHLVAAVVLPQRRHAAVGIVEIAEDDGPRRAGLGAGGGQAAVGHRDPRPLLLDGRGLLHPLVLGLDLGRGDPLDAVGALLHHPTGADRDLRVELQPAQEIDVRLRLRVVVGLDGEQPLLAGRQALLEVEVVEPADLVRAVVRAVAGPDAPVVDHHVEAVGVVHGGRHRAHRLARRVLALHARDRLQAHALRVLGAALEVAVHPDPVHLAAALHLGLADDRDVVLRLAGDHARAAPGARAQVDRHAPGVRRVVEVRLLP